MEDNLTMQIFSFLGFKALALVCGLICVYFGYKLFSKGIFGRAGNMDAEFNDLKIVLRKAAPGTFFALFGFIIMFATVTKGLQVTSQKGNSGNGNVDIQAEKNISNNDNVDIQAENNSGFTIEEGNMKGNGIREFEQPDN